MLPPIVQIVKRFGPVGGMESYVWRLTHGLSERGLLVSVVCEEVIGEVSADIAVILVEKSSEKPRWRSMLRFRERVESLLNDRFQGQKIIIHSHERSISHQVSTFHGPPINAGGNLKWFQKLSPRIRGWMDMERHELLSPRVQCVVPVSSQVQDALTAEYPDLRCKYLQLGWPGVDAAPKHKVRNDIGQASMHFVFVGKEWKRKGLRRAIDIFDSLRATNPNVSLDVYGVDSDKIQKKMRRKAGIRFIGWSSEIPWAKYDVLLHPAENEPFGMVVAEARSHGVAVLMSDRVGAADLAFDHVKAVTIDASLSEWISALNSLTANPNISSEVKWSWDDLVDLHCQSIYPKVKVDIL